MSAAVVYRGFPRDRDRWAQLAEATTNIFLTPEWAEAWWDHFAPAGAEPLTVDSPNGAAPWLAVLRASRLGPWRILRFAGHGPADELGPTCAPQSRSLAGKELLAALREHSACDALVWEQLAGDRDWESLLPARPLARIPSPTVRFEHATWDAFLAARTGSFRAQLRRDRRAVEAAGEHRVELVSEPERVDAGMDALFAMHRERWGADSGFLADGADAFHRAFAHVALKRGWLRLWLLEVNGAIEAVWYGFRFGAGNDAHYQSGRSSTCPSGGGNLLVATAMQATLEDGLAEYRFLRGGETYKSRWANSGYELETLVSGISRSGRTVIGGALPVRAARRLILAR